MLEVPINRITTLNDEQPNMDAPYVLYWMIAFRRVNYNFSLQRAIEWANKLSKPLLIIEPMTIALFSENQINSDVVSTILLLQILIVYFVFDSAISLLIIFKI